MNNDQEVVIKNEISPLVSKAQSLVVKNQEQRNEAVKFGVALKELKKKIEAEYHPTENKEKAYITYQGALDTEKKFYVPIDTAIECVRKSLKAFDTAEAQRIQKEAEEAEAKRKEEERKEREKLEAKAEKAESKGQIEKAEMLRDQAENVTVAPKFTPPPQNVAKLVTKAKITNMMMLCQAIGRGEIPFSVLEVNQAQLNAWAKAQDHKQKFAGIELYQEANSRVA